MSFSRWVTQAIPFEAHRKQSQSTLRMHARTHPTLLLGILTLNVVGGRSQ